MSDTADEDVMKLAQSDDLIETMVEAALNAQIIPSEIHPGHGVRLEDYLEFPSPGTAIELGVTLTSRDKDGKPKFHGYSDIRGDELDDFYRAILRPIMRAVLDALTTDRAASAARVERLERENEEMQEKLHSIEEWCNAYPLTIFREPDLAKARALLEAGGMTLDAVSASSMRHVLQGVARIAARSALEGK